MNYFLLLLLFPADWRFEVVKPPVFEVVTNTTKEVPPPQDEGKDYLVMYTCKSCGPCRNWLAGSEYKKILAAGIEVRVLEVEQDESRKVHAQRFPTFYWVDGKTNKLRKETKHEGAITAEQVFSYAKAEKPKETKSSGFYNPSLYNGKIGNSHQSRDTLIMHLYKDGVHRGRHTMKELTSLSDQQLVDLHDREHP